MPNGKTINAGAVKDKLTENKSGDNKENSKTWKKLKVEKGQEIRDKKAEIDKKKATLNNVVAKSEKEIEDLEQETNRLKKEHQEAVEKDFQNDETHQEVLKNTVNADFKAFPPYICALVEYKYQNGVTDKGNPTYVDRAFTVDFEWHTDLDEYVIILDKKHLCKDDMLKLYNAFRVSIKDTLEVTMRRYKDHYNKTKEEKQVQLGLFKNDFQEPNIPFIPVTLKVKSILKEDFVILKMFCTKYRDEIFAIKIPGKMNFLTIQDIYFVFTNWQKIIDRVLEGKESKEN